MVRDSEYQPLGWREVSRTSWARHGPKAVACFAAGALLGGMMTWGASGSATALPASPTATPEHVVNVPRLLPSDYAGLDPDFYDHLQLSNVRSPIKPITSLDQDYRLLKPARDQGGIPRTTFRGFGDCISVFDGPLPAFPGMIAPPLREHDNILKPDTHCALWSHGELDLAEVNTSRVAIEEARARPFFMKKEWDIQGDFTEHNLWTPKNAHSGWRHFDPADVTQCLMGRRVLIQGDSMKRHVFERLVQLHRGMPTRVGLFYDRSISEYVVYSNGTDYLRVNIDKGEYEGNIADHSRERDIADDVVLRITFDWQDNEKDFHKTVNRARLFDVDMVVFGGNYWFDPDEPFDDLPQAIDQLHNDGFNGTFSMYLVPPSSRFDFAYGGRTGLMRTYAAQTPHPFVHTLPSDLIAIAADKRDHPQRNCGQNNDDNFCWADKHFSCTRPAYKDYLIPGDGVDWYKAPRGFDCSDSFNLAVVESWLNSVCPPAPKL